MEKKEVRIIFFGTPEFAAVVLRALFENKFNVAAAVTQPDGKVGRRQEIAFSPVKKSALENGIEVLQPENLKENDAIRDIREMGADLFVVAAYGKILPREILEIPKFGAVNVHASLLPKYRGASPVQRAILAGEKETGITLMKMNEKMDEGDILAQEKIAIGENETADKLLERLGKLGAETAARFIPDWILGKIEPMSQDHSKATYCKPIRREDGKIDWNSTAENIYRKWRAYQPWPGIFSELKMKNRSRIIKFSMIEVVPAVETGEKPGKIIEYNQAAAVQARGGLIVLKEIQPEGKKKMSVADFVRGYPEFIGSKFK